MARSVHVLFLFARFGKSQWQGYIESGPNRGPRYSRDGQENACLYDVNNTCIKFRAWGSPYGPVPDVHKSTLVFADGLWPVLLGQPALATADQVCRIESFWPLDAATTTALNFSAFVSPLYLLWCGWARATDLSAERGVNCFEAYAGYGFVAGLIFSPVVEFSVLGFNPGTINFPAEYTIPLYTMGGDLFTVPNNDITLLHPYEVMPVLYNVGPNQCANLLLGGTGCPIEINRTISPALQSASNLAPYSYILSAFNFTCVFGFAMLTLLLIIKSKKVPVLYLGILIFEGIFAGIVRAILLLGRNAYTGYAWEWATSAYLQYMPEVFSATSTIMMAFMWVRILSHRFFRFSHAELVFDVVAVLAAMSVCAVLTSIVVDAIQVVLVCGSVAEVLTCLSTAVYYREQTNIMLFILNVTSSALMFVTCFIFIVQLLAITKGSSGQNNTLQAATKKMFQLVALQLGLLAPLLVFNYLQSQYEGVYGGSGSAVLYELVVGQGKFTLQTGLGFLQVFTVASNTSVLFPSSSSSSSSSSSTEM